MKKNDLAGARAMTARASCFSLAISTCLGGTLVMSTGRTARPIQFDPFFDGTGGQVALPGYAGQQGNLPPGTTPIVGNVRGTTRAGAGTPNPAAYHDIAAVTLVDGRAMGAGMRGSGLGLRGTIIPRATPGGVPAGVRPHRMENLQIEIDPHIVGQSSRVRLGDLTESIMQQADQVGFDTVPDPMSIEDFRLRGAATMHSAAALTGNQYMTNVAAEDNGPPLPAAIQARNLGHVAQPARGYAQQPDGMQVQAAALQASPSRRAASPLAAFNQPPPQAVPGGRELRSIDLSHSPSAFSASTPPSPNVRVTFEFEHVGIWPARYHSVVVEPGFIILVWRNDYAGADPWWPPVNENSPALAMSIDGSDTAYLVHPTGIQYSYENLSFCTLSVERTAGPQAG